MHYSLLAVHLDAQNTMININCNGVFDVKERVSVQESLGPVNPNLENQEVQAVVMERTSQCKPEKETCSGRYFTPGQTSFSFCTV